MKATKFLVGDRVGRLTVTERVKYVKHAPLNRVLTCLCDCGVVKQMTTQQLSGGVKSCGCLLLEHRKKQNITHGQAKRNKHTSTYRAWTAMLSQRDQIRNQRRTILNVHLVKIIKVLARDMPERDIPPLLGLPSKIVMEMLRGRSWVDI